MRVEQQHHRALADQILYLALLRLLAVGAVAEQQQLMELRALQGVPAVAAQVSREVRGIRPTRHHHKAVTAALGLTDSQITAVAVAGVLQPLV